MPISQDGLTPAAMNTPSTQSEAERLRWLEVRMRWLANVRWVALALWASLALVTLTPRFDAGRAFWVGAILLAGVFVNIELVMALRTRRPIVPGVLLAADIVLFSLLLANCGGATSPYSSFLLVYITLAALIVSPRWILGLAVLAIGCHALLFFIEPPMPAGHAMHMGGEGFESHVREMWIAFTLTTALITYFVGRLSAAQRQLELELATTAERLDRSRRLAALGTLATGAAHELGSPLGTITIASEELRHRLERERHPMATDARLVMEEARRCRAILDQLVADAGLTAGETPRELTVRELLTAMSESVPPVLAAQLKLECDPGIAASTALVPLRAFQRCALNLLRNAADASPRDATIEILAKREGSRVRILVCDHGAGMTAEVLAHAGEPFFTTKPPGSGMGLGLYLCHSIASSLGWGFEIHSEAGRGTTAELSLPLCVREREQ